MLSLTRRRVTREVCCQWQNDRLSRWLRERRIFYVVNEKGDEVPVLGELYLHAAISHWVPEVAAGRLTTRQLEELRFYACGVGGWEGRPHRLSTEAFVTKCSDLVRQGYDAEARARYELIVRGKEAAQAEIARVARKGDH